MKKVLFSLVSVCVLLCDLHAQKAQTPFRRLSYSQFLEEMQNCPDSVYRLKNALVYYDPKTDDLRFGSTKTDNDWRVIPNEMPLVVIDKNLYLTNVLFEEIKNDRGFRHAYIAKIHFTKKFNIFIRCTDKEESYNYTYLPVFHSCIFEEEILYSYLSCENDGNEVAQKLVFT